MLQNSGNILFISSEEHECNRFRTAFVRHYNIFTAGSIREGYKLLNEYDIHTVLVRQEMSEMTGLQFSESINHSFPDIIKIVLTDSDDTESLERAAQSDLIYRFVQLPYDSQDLKMTLDGALKLSEAQFQNRKLMKQLEKYKADQENILRLFKRYVPGEVVSQALNANEEQLMRPGESRVVSVLFADIRDFTRLASRMRPTQVVEFLNDYWETISECVKQNKGSINKYMGDGMLAIFGAPVSYIHNHENAVSAALDMREALISFNEKYSSTLGTEIKIGTGINSGEVVVGNIGTDNYMEYTVIGDTVNIASRLELISKQKPNSIIISERTYELVKYAFETTELKETDVNGKDNKVVYCEVIGRRPDNVIDMKSNLKS